MKLAVMQPYIFPYIGYFQLINAVDKFIFYDDVNFIKGGWINRNRILVNGADHLFTIPLLKMSTNNLIKESYINNINYIQWRKKILQTIEHNYRKAPFYNEAYRLVNKVLDVDHSSIGELAISSIHAVSLYLNVKTEFIVSSETYQNKDLERQERLIDICNIENAEHYINALGGQDLYKKEEFLKNGIKLDFIESLPIEYQQFNKGFVPSLSIIDVMMFNSIEGIGEMLTKYELK